MSNTMRQADSSVPVRTLDNIRPSQAKAGLHPTHESDLVRSSDGLGLGDVIVDAVLKHYGSVKAAAISLRVDPSLMQREFDAGKFARLNDADAAAKAAIADALYQTFGRLEDPKARAVRRMREAVECLKDIEAFLEYVS